MSHNNTMQACLRLAGPMMISADACEIDRQEFFCDECPPQVPLVGKSRAMVETLRTLRKVAQSRCNPILIVGPSGTGKELAAQAVHAWRGGTEENFIAVNCAALTANLLESELFGHVRGSFTGADRDKTGLFEAAGEGTIFLDEISEMPSDLQAKLLRVLQERTFRKVGGTKTLTCRATIIASSNRDLLAESEAGRFRQDLYYRLAIFPIPMPALQSPGRSSDIPLLARYLLKTLDMCPDTDIKGFTPAAEQMLLGHPWTGNVRELRNIVARAMVMETSSQIQADSLMFDRRETATDGAVAAVATNDLSLEAAEREFIYRALQETGWQRTRAAGLLGITRATLYAKLKRYGIKQPGEDGEEVSCDEMEELPVREAC